MRICTKESFTMWWRAALVNYSEKNGVHDFNSVCSVSKNTLYNYWIGGQHTFEDFDFRFSKIAQTMGLEFKIILGESQYNLTFEGIKKFYTNHSTGGLARFDWNVYNNMRRFVTKKKRMSIRLDVIFKLLKFTGAKLVFDQKQLT